MGGVLDGTHSRVNKHEPSAERMRGRNWRSQFPGRDALEDSSCGRGEAERLAQPGSRSRDYFCSAARSRASSRFTVTWQLTNFWPTCRVKSPLGTSVGRHWPGAGVTSWLTLCWCWSSSTMSTLPDERGASITNTTGSVPYTVPGSARHPVTATGAADAGALATARVGFTSGAGTAPPQPIASIAKPNKTGARRTLRGYANRSASARPTCAAPSLLVQTTLALTLAPDP